MDWLKQFYQQHSGSLILMLAGLIGILSAFLAWLLNRSPHNKKPFLDSEKNPIPKDTADQTGDVTSGEIPPQNSLGTIPPPPTPYLAHPYPLQKNFTGRDKERKMLCEWLERGEKPILAMTGPGGMGKSSLAWHWLQKDLPDNCQPPEGIIWWSFYANDSGLESFINAALAYTSKGTINPQEINALGEKMKKLHQILSLHRFLFVLDGVERLLRHYTRLDAPYIEGEKPAINEEQSCRACADPHLCTFFRDLASNHTQSHTLLLSRFLPLGVEGLEGCQKWNLTELSLEDTHHFFQRQGLDWTQAEVEQVCKPYGFLPLYLRLLINVILHEPLPRGEARPNPEKTIAKLKQNSYHILEIACLSLTEEQQELLSRISAFRSAVNEEAILTISPTKNNKTINKALSSLIDHELLLFDERERKYDLHPIVRAYSYEHLKDKKKIHAKLREYFSTIPMPKSINSLDDLSPVIELYYHTIQAGDYNRAWEIYRTRISDPLYNHFSPYQLGVELPLGLFPEGKHHPPLLKEKYAQSCTLNDLSLNYSRSGQPRHSVPLIKIQNKLREKEGDTQNLTIGLDNLANDQIALGELEEAQANLQRSIQLCKEIGDTSLEAVGHQELGRLLTYKGDWQGAEEALKASLEIFEQEKHPQGTGITWAYRCLAALLQEDFSQGLKWAKKAWDLAKAKTYEFDIVQADWLAGTAYRGLAKFAQAEEHLQVALHHCRQISLVEFEADILLQLAQVRHAQKRMTEALQLAQEALKIADRCEYRLQQADIHLFLAQLALDDGDEVKARTEAAIAHERASCGYKPTLNKIKHFLAQYG